MLILVVLFGMVMISFLIGINCATTNVDQYTGFERFMNDLALWTFLVLHAFIIIAYSVDLYFL